MSSSQNAATNETAACGSKRSRNEVELLGASTVAADGEAKRCRPRPGVAHTGGALALPATVHASSFPKPSGDALALAPSMVVATRANINNTAPARSLLDSTQFGYASRDDASPLWADTSHYLASVPHAELYPNLSPAAPNTGAGAMLLPMAPFGVGNRLPETQSSPHHLSSLLRSTTNPPLNDDSLDSSGYRSYLAALQQTVLPGNQSLGPEHRATQSNPFYGLLDATHASYPISSLPLAVQAVPEPLQQQARLSPSVFVPPGIRSNPFDSLVHAAHASYPMTSLPLAATRQEVPEPRQQQAHLFPNTFALPGTWPERDGRVAAPPRGLWNPSKQRSTESAFPMSWPNSIPADLRHQPPPSSTVEQYILQSRASTGSNSNNDNRFNLESAMVSTAEQDIMQSRASTGSISNNDNRFNLESAMVLPAQAGASYLQGAPGLPFAATSMTSTALEKSNLYLPKSLAHPNDELLLSSHQVLLRQQIEAFEATEEDAKTTFRGRNRRIRVGQVGIRCRHCKNTPPFQRQPGSMYFPCSTAGIYQASQNMSSTHLQCGLCHAMPEQLRQQFAELIPTKMTGSMAGRPYWTNCAREMGLVDTEEGIQFGPRK
jgi:hypothetical protein